MDAGTSTPAASDDAAAWLVHIADMLGAEASGMLTLRPDGSHQLVVNGLGERAIAEYRDHYHRLDPLPSLLAGRPDGRALVIDTTSHPAYVAQHELSAGYLRPHGIDHLVATQWRQADGSLHVLGVQRFRGSAPFSVAHGKELDRLIHHWQIGGKLPPPQGFAARSASAPDTRRTCDIAAQLAIPLVLVDSQLAVVWANPAARRQQSGPWSALFEESAKHPSAPALRRSLQDLTRACLRQRAESEALLAVPEGTWFATAAPLEGKPGLALLRLTEVHQLGSGIRNRLQRLFGLTPAEAEMTAMLARGDSLAAIAEARGVSVDTVRTQLRTVFRKTGIHRQGQLICAVGKLAAG